jgi:hypothetical protein
MRALRTCVDSAEQAYSVGMRGRATRGLVLVLLAATPVPGQTLPDGPVTFGNGRVVVAGEVTATVASASAADEGWFNYSSYEHSTLRNLRVAIAGEARLTRRLSFVGELRSDHFAMVEAYAAFLRIRPWTDRAVDVHVGRVPPTFGAFARRPYNLDNPVVGYPLAYQYLTSLRPDALPRHADDLAAMRARGWAASYPVGRTDAAPGLPLVNALEWDTGVQLRARHGPVTWLTSVTTGTLSNPRVADDNRGPQVAGRMTIDAGPAVTIGVSAARGPYLTRSLAGVLPAGSTPERHVQRAIGGDVAVSRGRWLVRAEALRSSWHLPALNEPRLPTSVSAWAGFAEGRLRMAPGLDLAARIERLDFSRITTSRGRLPWDAPVDRVEVAVGWTPRRHLTVKAAWQVNMRDGGQVRTSRLGALQCIAWF